jgi:hypothetical protein
MVQEIYKGAAANDKTGTPARQAADIINGNFDYLNNKITRKDGIVVSTGLVLVGQDITLNANWQWIINTVDYSNPYDVVLNFPLATTGKSRLDIIALTTSNTAIRIVGVESTSNPVSTVLPDNMIQASLVLVTDSAVDAPSIPIIGDAFVKKQESQDFIANYGATTVIDQINLIDDRSSISLIGSATDVKSVQLFGEFIRPGKPHFFKNRTGHDVKLWHLSGTGNIKYFFPNAQDLIVKNGEIIEFNTNANDSGNVRFEYVGIISDLSNYYNKTEIDSKISSVYKFRGNVANYASLPTVGLTIGDVYNALDTDKNWAWTGTVWDNLGGTFDISGKQDVLTETNFGAFENSLTAKATPLDADLVSIIDTADSNKAKKTTFTQLKSFFKTYYDTLYTTNAVNSYYLSQQGCVSDADLSLGSSTFGTDNTTAIQNILNSASPTNQLTIYWDGRYSVTGLLIKSYTTIIVKEGCGAILRDNSNKAIFSNENAIPVSMPGVFPDNNISIYGGIWNGNGYRSGIARQIHSNSTYGFVTGIRMYGVKDIIFENLKVINTRTYAVLFHTNENVVVNNLEIYQGDTVYVNQDGLDFDGYQNNIIVNGLRAKCGDDAITLNTCLLKNNVDAGDYTVYFGKSGPATNVDFQNLYFDNSQMGIRLLSGNKLIDNVTIRNVHGICQAYWLIIDNYLQNPAGLEDAGPGNVGNVLIENVKVTNLSGTAYSGNFAKGSINCNVENLTLRNYVRRDFAVNNNPSLMVNGINTLVRFLNIENYYSYDSSTINTINHFLIDKATVNNIFISGYCERVNSDNNSPLLKIINSAKVDKLFLNGVTVLGSNNLLDNSANLNYIRAVGIHHKATDNTTPTFKTTTTINDIVLSNYYGFNIKSGVFTTSRGDGFLDILPGTPWTASLSNLKAYWKLDESSGNAIDSSGNSYTLTNTGTTIYASSKINNGISLNGTSNYLTATVVTALPVISINLWVNLSSFAGIQMLYSNEERSDSKYGVSLYTNGSVVGNQLVFSIGNGATKSDRIIPQTLTTATWYMVTFTFDSNALKVYINGVLKDSATLSFTSIGSNTSNRFRLGAEAGSTPIYYSLAKLDEIGIWEKALNVSEITELYNVGLGKSHPF